MKGKLPCKRCGKPHRRRSMKTNHGTMWIWSMGGHDYWPVSPMEYVAILLKENRKLKRRIKEIQTPLFLKGKRCFKYDEKEEKWKSVKEKK